MSENSFAHLSDEDLAIAARNDVDAFEILVERFEKPIIRYILRISHFSKEEAEEIFQEICIKSWKNLNDFDAKLKFSSWIYRIAHNETISEFRKAKVRGLDDEVVWDDELMSNLPGKIDLSSDLHEKLESETVRKLIDLLPEKYRVVLILFFLEEKSYEEISDILKTPSGTVATLLSRAKKAFRELAERQNITFT